MKSFVSYEEYFNCDDGCSVMKVTQYNTANEPESLLELAIYPMYPKYRNWLQQLKWIWQILTRECVWDDQIMLGKEDCERLGRTLLKLSKEME